MIRLLRWLFTGDAHMHVWKDYKEVPYFKNNGERPSRINYIRKCSICGKLKNFKLS